MNTNEPVTIFFWDGEKLLRMRSLAKRRKERIIECHDALEKFKRIVMDQETELVNLQVEACLRANEFRELQRENAELYDELNRWRNPTAY